MNWNKLKDGMCPKCGHILEQVPDALMLRCSNGQCTFSISEGKLQSILTSKPRQPDRANEPDENFDSLQNL